MTVKGNTIVHNNLDHDNNGGGLKVGNGVQLFTNNYVVSYNVVHDNLAEGLWCDGSGSVTFDHNTVYNNGSEGIRAEVSDHTTISNNVLYGNGLQSGSEGPHANSPHGFWSWGYHWELCQGAQRGDERRHRGRFQQPFRSRFPGWDECLRKLYHCAQRNRNCWKVVRNRERQRYKRFLDRVRNV
jgi:parallel beta-helix repeat protein